MDKFEKWAPVHKEGQYDVVEIKYTAQGVSFVMQDDKREEKLFHHENIVPYNVTDETYRADLWKLENRFLKATDSEYLNIFKAKSPVFPEKSTHYCIIGTNIVIDIIATKEPEVKQYEKI